MLLTKRKEIRAESRSTAEILSILDGNASYSDSGVAVSTRSAMQQATVYACVKLVSEVIAQLPIVVQTKNDSGQWVNSDHDMLGVLAAPNDWQTQMEFISHLVVWGELRGNGYYFKARDREGVVSRLYPLVGDDVTPEKASLSSMSYRVTQSADIKAGIYSPEAIYHYRNFGSEGYVGYSTIGNMRNAIGLALGTEKHGSMMFRQGAHPGLVLNVPQADPDQLKALQKKLHDKHSGVENAYRAMVLKGDIKVQSVAIKNTDAQFLETRHFEKQEIASVFGVPLFLLNDTKNSTTWGTGLEQQLRAFKTVSLQPRLTRLGQTTVRELVPRAEQPKTRMIFDTDMLTLGDFKDRMEGYRSGIESGVLNPDECREVEGRNPRPGGDKFRIPANTNVEGEEPDAGGGRPSPLPPFPIRED